MRAHERSAEYSRLRSILQGMGSVLIAFSGGSDSAFLLKAAKECRGGGAEIRVCGFTGQVK